MTASHVYLQIVYPARHRHGQRLEVLLRAIDGISQAGAVPLAKVATGRPGLGQYWQRVTVVRTNAAVRDLRQPNANDGKDGGN